MGKCQALGDGEHWGHRSGPGEQGWHFQHQQPQKQEENVASQVPTAHCEFPKASLVQTPFPRTFSSEHHMLPHFSPQLT